MILYKYLPPERTDVLNNLSIRYTQAEALDDVFEQKPSFNSDGKIINPIGSRHFFLEDSLAEDFIRTGGENSIKISELIRELVRHHVEASFKKDPTFIMEAIHWVPVGNLNSDLVGGFRAISAQLHKSSKLVLSLTEDPTSIEMWGKYALNSSGFVIGFDTDNDYFIKTGHAANDGCIHKVFYSSSRPVGFPEAISFTDMYLTKHKSWAYQTEWRVLQEKKNCSATLNISPHPVFLFNYPVTMIAEIIIGPNASPDLENEIIEIISQSGYQHIKLFKAVLDPLEYKINNELFIKL